MRGARALFTPCARECNTAKTGETPRILAVFERSAGNKGFSSSTPLTPRKHSQFCRVADCRTLDSMRIRWFPVQSRKHKGSRTLSPIRPVPRWFRVESEESADTPNSAKTQRFRETAPFRTPAKASSQSSAEFCAPKGAPRSSAPLRGPLAPEGSPAWPQGAPWSSAPLRGPPVAEAKRPRRYSIARDSTPPRAFYTAPRKRWRILPVPRRTRELHKPYAYPPMLRPYRLNREKANTPVRASSGRSSGRSSALWALARPYPRTATTGENRDIRRIPTYGTVTRRIHGGIGLCIAASPSWCDATGGLQTSNPPLTPRNHWSFERVGGGGFSRGRVGGGRYPRTSETHEMEITLARRWSYPSHVRICPAPRNFAMSESGIWLDWRKM